MFAVVLNMYTYPVEQKLYLSLLSQDSDFVTIPAGDGGLYILHLRVGHKALLLHVKGTSLRLQTFLVRLPKKWGSPPKLLHGGVSHFCGCGEEISAL